MRRFLIVGCGGSGGATIRFIQDQLLADLRPEGTKELPAAWQFVHVDVPTTPDSGPAPLGTVRDMGGRYMSVSSLGNTYERTALQLFQATKQRLDMVAGWTPDPRHCPVPVTEGAGQFRAVGRALTLTRLSDLQAVLAQAYEDLQKPDPWIGLSDQRRSTVAVGGDIVPIVIGSMAGGSGASMFLDVCRLVGSVPGIDPRTIGAFLFTSDVFRELPSDARRGIEGNALGAIGDVIAAQTNLSYEADHALLTSLGVNDVPQFAFARIFPIGSAIGGDGAVFGDGTPTGIFRGIGRALAALVLGDAGMQQNFVAHVVGNPQPTPTETDVFGWGTKAESFAWGSFGYASLSLGRDRYAEYAAQRLARAAADQLLRGHMDPGVTTPGSEQLKGKVDDGWALTLSKLRLPQPGQDVGAWFRGEAMSPDWVASESRRVVGDTVTMLSSTPAAAATDWFTAVTSRFPQFRDPVRQALGQAAYSWTERFAIDLEARVIEQFLDDVKRRGLPYAREVLKRLQGHLGVMVNTLQQAPDPNSFDPLALDAGVGQRVQSMKRAVVAAGHDLIDLVAGELARSTTRVLYAAGARYAADLLDSFESDVLEPLVQAASFALDELQASERTTAGQAGLAQLRTDIYREWPEDTDAVPTRFAHAENEILLTTAPEFPALYQEHVARSVTGGLPYTDAQGELVSQVIRGRWETQGGRLGEVPVITTRARWRAAVLKVSSETGESTPRSPASYSLEFAPPAILERARLFLERPGEPFAVFRSESIGSYLNDDYIPVSQLESRKSGFAQKFTEALRLARPLVGVSPAMVQALHPGKALSYSYVFSKLGLKPADEVVRRIRATIEGDQSMDTTSVLAALDGAVGDDATESRIAIFGSYPKYSPVVFSSLLGTVQDQFATLPDAARADLWRWKSTRPLSASLPMSAVEMRALVAGWYVGRLTGQVRTGTAEQPVIVWDTETTRWLPLVWPMLTDPARISSVDWLPVALESYSLALVQCNRDPSLKALQPYRALRRLCDASPNGPGNREALGGFAAEKNVSAWLQTGHIVGADPSPVVSNAVGLTVEERREKGREWIAKLIQWIDTDMLQEGVGANTGQRLGRVASWDELYDGLGTSRVRFLMIAPLVREVLVDLDQVLATAAQPIAGGDSFAPSEPPVVM